MASEYIKKLREEVNIILNRLEEVLQELDDDLKLHLLNSTDAANELILCIVIEKMLINNGVYTDPSKIKQISKIIAASIHTIVKDIAYIYKVTPGKWFENTIKYLTSRRIFGEFASVNREILKKMEKLRP